MIQLIIDKKKILIPSEWKDMNLTALIYYARYYWSELGNLIETMPDGEAYIKDEVQWRKMQFGLLRGLIPLTDLKYYTTVNGDIAHELVDDHKVTDFLTEPPKPMPQIIKSIDGYYGPKEFSFLTTSEFALADLQYIKVKEAMKDMGPFAEENLIQQLSLFTAILFREKKWMINVSHKDNRVNFDKQTVEKRAAKLKSVRKWLMIAAVIWYESHRLSLPGRYPFAFESDEKSPSSQLPDWQGAMLTIAESGTFGDFYSVEKTPVLYFIKEINRKRQIVKEQMAELEKQKQQHHAV